MFKEPRGKYQLFTAQLVLFVIHYDGAGQLFWFGLRKKMTSPGLSPECLAVNSPYQHIITLHLNIVMLGVTLRSLNCFCSVTATLSVIGKCSIFWWNFCVLKYKGLPNMVVRNMRFVKSPGNLQLCAPLLFSNIQRTEKVDNIKGGMT